VTKEYKEIRGVAYFPEYDAARRIADRLGYKRMSNYDLGWAIQKFVSGPYVSGGDIRAIEHYDKFGTAFVDKDGTVYRMNPPEVFEVGVTYALFTPESLENGDADERGWKQDFEPATLRDALDTINQYGPYDHAQGGFDDVIFYGDMQVSNYRTGEYITYDVVVKGSEKDLVRLMTFYNKRNK